MMSERNYGTMKVSIKIPLKSAAATILVAVNNLTRLRVYSSTSVLPRNATISLHLGKISESRGSISKISSASLPKELIRRSRTSYGSRFRENRSLVR